VVNDIEIGVMFWAGRDQLGEIKSLGVECGQLGIGGDIDLTAGFAEDWKFALAREHFKVATVVAAYTGESYADIPTVQRTVGFLPPATRRDRIRRTIEISDFAASLGVQSIGCHIGFVPEEPSDPDCQALIACVREICDHAARYGQTFALETGQEPASVLARFISDTARANLKINFDPANMILYGTGDPIAALEQLAPLVVSVHAKDGDWPDKDQPGSLGTERPLGQGAVGIRRFVETLKRVGYKGTVNVEREIEDQRQRLADIGDAVRLLSGLV